MNRRYPAWLLRIAPFLRWWPSVDRFSLRADAAAGAVGAIIVLPQGVAFASLAGLPPEYGLYAAMVPAAVAALWGSSHHLVSGPTNAISLVVLSTLSVLAEPGSAKYVQMALTLALMVGVMQLAMGVARLGALVNFISHTVVVGFTAGAAVLIIASQLQHVLGIPIPRGASLIETVEHVATHRGDIHPWAPLVGAVTIAAGIASRRWMPRVPYMIVALAIGGLAGYGLEQWLGRSEAGIRTLGALPSAIPHLSIPQTGLDTLRQLLGAALAVTLLGLTEAISIARSVALKSGQRIDANQEFIGQGLSNVVGSFFAAYPSSGSFNRSGANYEAGARTPLAAVFAAVALVPIVMLAGPLAAHLPKAAMAGLLFLVAWGLFDFAHMKAILHASRQEAGVMAVTFVATLVMHLEMAVLLGVVLSLMLYLNRTSQPGVRSLIPDPYDARRKVRERLPGEHECPQLKLLRIEGSVYFGAVSHVADYLGNLAERHPEQKHLLVMSKSINFVDVAGAELLFAEARARRKRGGGLYFHGTREGAERVLRYGPHAKEIGEDAFFVRKEDAIAACVAKLDHSICAGCKARIFRECASLPGAGERQ